MITSFGCGPDAFIIDETHDILDRKGKSFTLLKVDDVNNIGSLRLRVRSMVESLKFSRKMEVNKPFVTTPAFRDADRRRTILGPTFASGYTEFFPTFFKMAGYKLVVLPMGDKECVDLGLQYANNEVCYPATIVVGSLLKALRSGEYDLNDVAVIITQTGGQCRATNYIMLIKKALVAAGFEQVPVLSLALGNTLANEQPGFVVDAKKLAVPALFSLLFADCLSRMYYAARPRELERGIAKKIQYKYIEKSLPLIEARNYKGLRKLLAEAVKEYMANMDCNKPLPQIGVVGEIYIKYNEFGHLNVLDWLADQGVEVVARMNGNCAGGTGAFIDQTASLLNVEPLELNALAEKAQTVYPIASRCGVFSKTDIQNLLARHVSKADVALSVFHAVALQVIGTLSRGLDVQPPVFFCGGPFAFLPMLRKTFQENLHISDADCVAVSDARVVPAHGTALMAGTQSPEPIPMRDFLHNIENLSIDNDVLLQNRMAPLFENANDFAKWKQQKQNS